ncbi:hypothetical protein ABZP36_000343 [Zizania latifolia]
MQLCLQPLVDDGVQRALRCAVLVTTGHRKRRRATRVASAARPVNPSGDRRREYGESRMGRRPIHQLIGPRRNSTGSGATERRAREDEITIHGGAEVAVPGEPARRQWRSRGAAPRPRPQRALSECRRRASRVPRPAEAGAAVPAARHLNRALAECVVVTSCCPGETDAVRAFCGSAGTALKRSQCRRARVDLSLCLEAHQEP